MPVSFAEFLRTYAPAPGSSLHLVHCKTARESLKVFRATYNESFCKRIEQLEHRTLMLTRWRNRNVGRSSSTGLA